MKTLEEALLDLRHSPSGELFYANIQDLFSSLKDNEVFKDLLRHAIEQTIARTGIEFAIDAREELAAILTAMFEFGISVGQDMEKLPLTD